MKYCSHCAAKVSLKIPPGDRLPRYMCDRCGAVHYQNPKLVVGCIPEWQGRVLLCRRAIDPRSGLWTIPAGFMENGESLEQAAMRETREEALADVKIVAPLALLSIPHISQVYVVFRARLLEPKFGAGDESREVLLFDESELPWEALAFPVVHRALEYFFADRRQGAFEVHTGAVTIPLKFT